MEQKGTFVDFIDSALKSENKTLVSELISNLESMDSAKLTEWFSHWGYDISEEECTKLIDNKDQFQVIKPGTAVASY